MTPPLKLGGYRRTARSGQDRPLQFPPEGSVLWKSGEVPPAAYACSSFALFLKISRYIPYAANPATLTMADAFSPGVW